MGIETELITAADLHRLEQFDGLLIRDHTRIDDYTFAFAQRAAELGIALVDDPVSMQGCSSKLRQAELFEAHGVPTPKTLVLTRQTLPIVPALLGLPCVLKEPESSFSRGVHCVASEAELVERATALLSHMPALIAQEFLPTGFDWRIGLVDRQPIFACRYHMVPGHWQVVRDAGTPEYCEGRTEAVALGDVPAAVLASASLAGNAIGDGFYGIDVKDLDDRCVVIEVNDNPNVDAGHEDGVAGPELYEAVIGTIARRAFGAGR
jgi:glutathione synthase/RimK-type ligase-like ATP-grasp enzyme